jgi:hypothetical protein
MTSENTSGYKTFQATAVAIEAHVRVTQDANGLISAAGETDLDVGVTQEAVAASGYGTVKLWSAPGTYLVQAAGPVTRGAQLYAKAAGEVDDSGTYKSRLVALEAATAQGDIIEVAKIEDATYASAPYVSGDVGTLAAAGNSQATAAAIVKAVTTVTGADDTTGVVLPTAAAGLVYEIFNAVSNKHLHVYPATNDKINMGTADVSITMAAYTSGRFVAHDAINWSAIFTSA